MHWIGSWVDPRANLDAFKEEKNLAPAKNVALVAWPVAHHYTD
jgi:hypothetical protein